MKTTLTILVGLCLSAALISCDPPVAKVRRSIEIETYETESSLSRILQSEKMK